MLNRYAQLFGSKRLAGIELHQDVHVAIRPVLPCAVEPKTAMDVGACWANSLARSRRKAVRMAFKVPMVLQISGSEGTSSVNWPR